MIRRSKWFALFLLFGGISACAGGILYLVKREPSFYAASPPCDWDTRDKSARLLTRVQDLKNEIRSRNRWGDTFTTEDLNCFFVENMGRKGGLAALLPEGLHTPRVAIDGDRLQLGFRYGEGFWSAVVWVELRVWLVANETNVVAVEVCDLRTGLLPLGAQSVLDSISEAARDSNIDVSWYRNGSNPVGLFRFYADQQQPNSQILTLEVKNGKITIAGETQQEHLPATITGQLLPRTPNE